MRVFINVIFLYDSCDTVRRIIENYPQAKHTHTKMLHLTKIIVVRNSQDSNKFCFSIAFWFQMIKLYEISNSVMYDCYFDSFMNN